MTTALLIRHISRTAGTSYMLHPHDRPISIVDRVALSAIKTIRILIYSMTDSAEGTIF